MSALDEPVLTREQRRSNFMPEEDSAYVHALSSEQRSQLDPDWLSALPEFPLFVEITELAGDRIQVVSPSFAAGTIDLRDGSALAHVFRAMPRNLYLDMTGFTHRTWAPLLRAALRASLRVVVVYVEPAEYARSTSPAPGAIYDLSERIIGISPLPGFAALGSRVREQSTCFVPLLGFEGTRLAHLFEQAQPDPAKVVPVIGVPGFRVEYPFHTYLGNRQHLESDFLYSQVRLAKANCPFEAFHVLQQIATDYPRHLLQVAPIGTKPHALAAVLFSMARHREVELIYDNPIRKDKRTQGEARVCTYEVSTFVESDMYQALGRYS